MISQNESQVLFFFVAIFSSVCGFLERERQREGKIIKKKDKCSGVQFSDGYGGGTVGCVFQRHGSAI